MATKPFSLLEKETEDKIRNAINENKKCDINVSVGKNINAGKIDFIVNNDRVDDLIAKETVEIN